MMRLLLFARTDSVIGGCRKGFDERGIAITKKKTIYQLKIPQQLPTNHTSLLYAVNFTVTPNSLSRTTAKAFISTLSDVLFRPGRQDRDHPTATTSARPSTSFLLTSSRSSQELRPPPHSSPKPLVRPKRARPLNPLTLNSSSATRPSSPSKRPVLPLLSCNPPSQISSHKVCEGIVMVFSNTLVLRRCLLTRYECARTNKK